MIVSALSLLQMSAQDIFTLQEEYTAPVREVRAMWLTTLKGLDWPKKPASTPEETRLQQQALIKILDQLQQAGINTVLFQTRIRSTTAYPSAFEPWDEVFTGIPGKAPMYDPLQFALDECHKRGMELHAWVVAFPICRTDVARKLGKRALPAQQPKLCQRCGDQWMMDPGVPETADYIAKICREIVENYKVDGIHLDYIRYPEKSISFNDRRTYRKYGKGQDLNTWRKNNVTRVADKIHKAVKAVRPWVKISCSPVGKYADLPQQSSYGWNARDAVAQDAQGWLRDGIMDLIFPMMYFDGKHFYPFAIDWSEHSYGRQVAPGLGIYFLHRQQKDWELDIIRRQMFFTRTIGAAGQAHFRSQFFTDNVKGLYDFAAHDFYRKRALPPAMTWEDSVPPMPPAANIAAHGHELQLSWNRVADNIPGTPVKYNVYYCPADSFDIRTAEPLQFGIDTCSTTLTPVLLSRQRGYYAVTAIDAYGNESTARPVSIFTPVPCSWLTPNDDGQLDIPETDGAEFLLVTDFIGRQLMTLPYARKINVSQLAPGGYEIRTLGRKGKSHRLFRFWQE